MKKLQQAKISKMLMLLAIVMSVVLIVSACSDGGEDNNTNTTPSSNNNNTNTDNTGDTPKDEPEELEHVNLKWYFLTYGTPQDMDQVEAEFNKITEAEINATVDLVPVEAGEYSEKMNTVVAAAEEFDIVWTSNWNFIYDANINKGAFMPIEDMLEEYAPNATELFGDLIEDARVNGHIYAIPNFQTFTKTPGFVVQKRFADKYDLDIENTKSYEDLEPFLKKIKENESDEIIPFGGYKGLSPLWEIYGIQWAGVTHRLADPYKVIYTDFEPEWEEHLEIMHRWYKKGYINHDAATVADLKTLTATGNVAVINDFTLKPGGESDKKEDMGGNEVVYVPVADPTFTGVQPTMNAISQTSKNPERAVMLLDLMSSNADLFNLAKYGIEGEHYEKISDNRIKLIPDSGYDGTQGWVMGNETVGYLTEDEPENKWQMTLDMNNSAKKSALYGFNFTNEDAKTESAAMNAVVGEFGPGLQTGTLDPDVYLPQLREALEKAGAKAFLAEQQRQLDAWVEEQGK